MTKLFYASTLPIFAPVNAVNRLKRIFILLLLFVPGMLQAQVKYTISGYVKDSLSGESLIAAAIQVKGTTVGAYSNAYGFFSISLPEGNYPIVISYVGYRTDSEYIMLNHDVRLNANLNPAARQVKEVVIQAKKDDQNITSTDMGKIELPIDKVKNLPVAFGEVDILKTLQLLPGVQGGQKELPAYT